MNKKDFQLYNEYFIIKVFIFVFMTFMLFFFAITLYISDRSRMEAIETIGSRESLVVEGAKNRIDTHVNFVTKDLVLLKNEYLLALTLNEDMDQIADDWLIYSNERQLYTQLRFIDTTGMEIIRINTNNSSGATRVPSEDLQNKSDRYYFTETMNLPDNSIFYSSMDLNVENGVVETPYSLEFRLSTPIYIDDVLQGMIIINFNTSYLFEPMSYYQDISQGTFFVIDENGHYIYNQDDTKLYGFDIDERSSYSFDQNYPNVFDRLSNDISVALTDDGLFTVETFTFENAYISDTYTIHTTQSDLYILSQVDTQTNPYLFKTNIIPQLILLSIVNYWIFIVIIVFISIILTIVIYIRTKLDYETRFYATVDPLSKLYNRNYGITQLEKMIGEEENIAICFFDLNGLKSINDTFGHETGDAFITDIVEIVESFISKDDYIFRLGGDEFIIVTTRDESYLKALWQNVIDAFEQVNATHTKLYELSASHGIIKYDKEMTDVNHFISEADHLMYKDKKIYYGKKNS